MTPIDFTDASAIVTAVTDMLNSQIGVAVVFSGVIVGLGVRTIRGFVRAGR